ncbi:MAG TPA: hypothetical protein VKA67_01390, partial [Verrucomicrobiae bacterium]|nr:hypothetical protein [Verrucomicrobiae bacterium]
GIYKVGYPDVLTPTGGGTVAAINYPGVSTGAAGIVYNGSAGGGKVVYLGFPFETILSADVRNTYMADVLDYFGVSKPLRFESISPLPNNQIHLVISGEPGIYTLQTAAVFNVWGDATSLTNTDGTFEFTDSLATNQSVQFYRLKSSP